MTATRNAALAHARLAIVDVAGGKQPMRGEDAATHLVCNGEIYNHAVLRRQLASHRFGSRSDCEVVLHLYEEVGPACVERLDGMFAFVVCDGESFLVARDALGIKPLYVAREANGVWVASELKALQGMCLDYEALPPGSYITDGEQPVQRWYTPAWADTPGSERLRSHDELVTRLEQSIVKRLMSDVPVGVFLSGGLDSSIVLALACRHIARIDSFAVGFEGASDLEAARSVASTFGSRHHERIYTAREVADMLERVIFHLESYDPALIRSAVPCYFLSELASRYVKVALTGEGADELFAGYACFSELREAAELHRECARLLLGLGGMNLQRVDRMTMAHGLEGRVPFLDVEFVAWAMSIDPRLKLQSPRHPEKALLRRAVKAVLPTDIAWRRKEEFSRGSGAEAVLRAFAEERVSDSEMARASRDFPVDSPNTKEELYYRRIFSSMFPGEAAQRTVHRWHGMPARGQA